MKGKRYFNKIKKGICLQQLFSIFLQNHHTLQHTFANTALVFEIHQKASTSCFVTQICQPKFSIFQPLYPASYSTHMNTLITIKGLHSSVNSIGGHFSAVKNSITARCLNRTSENTPILTCTV